MKSHIYNQFKRGLLSADYKEYELKINSQIAEYEEQILNLKKEIKTGKKNKEDRAELKRQSKKIAGLMQATGEKLTEYIVFNFEKNARWNTYSEKEREEFKKNTRRDIYLELNRVTNRVQRGIRSYTVKTGLGVGVGTATALSGVSAAIGTAAGGLGAKAAVVLTTAIGDLCFSAGMGYLSMVIMDKLILRENFKELELLANDWYRTKQTENVDDVLLFALVRPLENYIEDLRASGSSKDSQIGLNLKSVQKDLAIIKILGIQEAKEKANQDF